MLLELQAVQRPPSPLAPAQPFHVAGEPILLGTSAPPIPILVIACNRPTVSRCLDKLFEYRPQGMEEQFPVFVSQDCGDQPTAEVIRSYGPKVTHLQVCVVNYQCGSF